LHELSTRIAGTARLVWPDYWLSIFGSQEYPPIGSLYALVVDAGCRIVLNYSGDSGEPLFPVRTWRS